MTGRVIHNEWEQVLIHTAKCDLCEHHNRSILYRCTICKRSLCTPCKESDSDDGAHYLNDGGRIVPGIPGAPLPIQAPRKTSAPGLRPETAVVAQTQGQRTSPRASRKRRRTVVEDTDDEYDDDNEEIPDSSRKGKKRQKTRRFETRSSTTKRRRGETSPAVRTEKKWRVNFEIGESSKQAAERVQEKRVARTATRKATTDFPDFESTLLGVGLLGADFLPALQTRNSTPDEQNLNILAMAAAQMAEAEDTEDERRQGARLQVPDSETEEGQDAQRRTPLFFTEADDDVDLEPQVAAPLTDSDDAEYAEKSSEGHLLTQDSPDITHHGAVGEAFDKVAAATRQELADAAAFTVVNNAATVDCPLAGFSDHKPSGSARSRRAETEEVERRGHAVSSAAQPRRGMVYRSKGAVARIQALKKHRSE